MSGGDNEGARPKLPRSGLASEVLGDGGLATGAGQAPEAGSAAPPERAAERPAVPAPLLGGADRLLLFADALQQDVEEETPEELETWVLFRLGEQQYGLPVTDVREVLRVGEITRVPHAPHPVKGVTNVRGRVVPVLDLRQRLGLPTVPVGRRSRLVVLQAGERQIGLLVDRVEQVAQLAPSRFRPPPVAAADCVEALYAPEEAEEEEAAEAGAEEVATEPEVLLLAPRRVLRLAEDDGAPPEERP